MVRRGAEVKKLDTTRPVTAAASGGLTTPKNVGFAVDVIGMNYQVNNYDNVHKYFPNTPVTSSEDASELHRSPRHECLYQRGTDRLCQ